MTLPINIDCSATSHTHTHILFPLNWQMEKSFSRISFDPHPCKSITDCKFNRKINTRNCNSWNQFKDFFYASFPSSS